jgi:hypothetical protein
VVLKGLQEGEVVLLNEPADTKGMKLIPLKWSCLLINIGFKTICALL